MSTHLAGLQRFLVEWYMPAVTGQAVEEIAARLGDGVALASGRGEPVELVMVLAVPADEVVFGVFAADSARAVARVCSRAGLRAERLSAAVGAVADAACGKPSAWTQLAQPAGPVGRQPRP